jgi:transmembrane sensor
MDRFIALLKKKLLEEMSGEEENELEVILNNNPDLLTIYLHCFSKEKSISSEDELNAEEAFAVHFVKMQLKK